MDYRREIDGLRAIAVLPVILFHAGFNAFSGGFVGVDVFFVISGYLITTVLVWELDEGIFSIANFYERRARRILPALFLVMFTCIPLAWLWLPSGDMTDFSQSLVAVSLFASNILFWRESGYFDAAAELKPLLHTWSLAVEEQYYILFPLFLMLFWRLGRRWIMILLAISGVTSLALAQWLSVAKPSAAFFLLPARGWELLMGAFAAFYLSRTDRARFSRGAGEVGGWSGLLLITCSVFTYSQATPFPGSYALVPTVGAVLVILFATQETTVGKFLGNRVFVGIGLLSYSAYLWHQPLFAFARQGGLIGSSDLVLAALCALTSLAAYLSWKYVETPFRVKGKVPRKSVFSFGILGMMFFIAAGSLGHVKDGFPNSAEVLPTSSDKRTSQNFIVLGDSHGSHLISGLSSVTSGSVVDYTSCGCIPFRNVDRYDSRFAPGECAKIVNGYLDKLIAEDPEATIILSSMGPVYLEGTPFNGKDSARVTGLGVELVTDKSLKDRWKVFEIGLRSTLDELSKLKNTSIVVAIDIPELGIDHGGAKQDKAVKLGTFTFSDCVTDSGAEECFVSRHSYDERSQAYKDLVKRVVSEFPKAHIFDPTDAFCDDSKCKGFDPEFGFLYRDFDHLSGAGSRFYATKLVEFLRTE